MGLTERTLTPRENFRVVPTYKMAFPEALTTVAARGFHQYLVTAYGTSSAVTQTPPPCEAKDKIIYRSASSSQLCNLQSSLNCVARTSFR